jgi:hypothetical protein
MTTQGEQQVAWVVPAQANYWGPKGSIMGSNPFYGSVTVSPTLSWDPTQADGLIPQSIVGNKPIRVMTSGMTKTLSEQSSDSSQQQFFVDLKKQMMDIMDSLDNPAYNFIRPRLMGKLNALHLFDPNDVTQEKRTIISRLTGYRGQLASNTQLGPTDRLCGEAALVYECQDAIRHGDLDSAQGLLTKYMPNVQNDDARRALFFAEETLDERLGDYTGAMAALNSAKAIQWSVQKRKYVTPSYNFIIDRLEQEASAAGKPFNKQQIQGQTQSAPTQTAVMQNYPNPFNPTSTISYQLSNPGRVSLKVFDVIGREVADLREGMQEAGYYTAVFDASRLASGIYFSRLVVQGQDGKQYFKTMKMLLLK